MGTRSVIIITGPAVYQEHETIRLYKHWDGYPTGNLPIIAEALETADKALKWQDKQSPSMPHYARQKLTTAAVASWIVGASTSLSGPGARQEFTAPEPFSPSMLGNQGDLEWIYKIDLHAKTVTTYDARQADSPQDAYSRGAVNPFNWLDRIRPEYYNGEHKILDETISRLIRAGYSIKEQNAPLLECVATLQKFD